MGPSLPFSFSLSLNFYLLYYSCDSCGIYQAFFLLLLQWTFLLLLRFLHTFSFNNCKQFLFNMFLLNLGEKFASKFLLQLVILVEFVILALFATSIHFWKQFPLNLYCPVFNPRHKCTKENEGKCMDIFSMRPRFVKKILQLYIFMSVFILQV